MDHKEWDHNPDIENDLDFGFNDEADREADTGYGEDLGYDER